MNAPSLWLAKTPLILASGSTARRALLEAAEIPVEILRAPIDEAAIARSPGASGLPPLRIAELLAEAKSRVARECAPGRLILTADQVADFRGELLMKAGSRAEARAQLRRLSGHPHQLHSAAMLHDGEKVVWEGVETARLEMRHFSDAFLDAYLDRMGETVLETVGGYQLEALGPHLFSKIEGDHATILGLPLLPLLEALRNNGYLMT